MLSVRTLLLGIASLTAAAVARSVTGDRVLVVLDSDIQKGEYSKLWSSLECKSRLDAVHLDKHLKEVFEYIQRKAKNADAA